MTPAAVLAEIRRRGATAYRQGETIRLRPASVLPVELVEAVRKYKAELLPLVPERPPEHPPAHDTAFAEVDAYLVESRVLGLDVWLAPDDATAALLEREFATEGITRLVFTVAELLPIADMLEADRRSLLGALARLKRAMPGATLDRVTAPAEMVQ